MTSPRLAPQGPSQLLTSLLARLPDCTNRAMIDQAAVDFAFLNSKAGRKRLVRVRLCVVLLTSRRLTLF
jgi:regulator of nonsense transcripts 2